MNLLTDKRAPIFRRYLFAAFGSTTVAAVYGIVDMIVVGQSQGPDGVAALAVVLPLWTIIYAFVFLLPAVFPTWTLWLAMPLTELATAVYAARRMFASRT